MRDSVMRTAKSASNEGRSLVRINITDDTNDKFSGKKAGAIPLAHVLSPRATERLFSSQWRSRVRVTSIRARHDEPHRIAEHVVTQRGKICERHRALSVERIPGNHGFVDDIRNEVDR